METLSNVPVKFIRIYGSVKGPPELNAPPLYGSVEISFAAGMNQLKDPILIDPVRCKVWDVRSLMKEAPRQVGFNILEGIYVLDYPLFLTDRSALEM